MPHSNYLIVELNEIVAMDLALSVQDHDVPGCVLVTNGPAEALAALADKPTIRFAFIHANPAGFDATPLGQALIARGALCVFMGDAAERANSPVPVLRWPFSPAEVGSLMRCIMKFPAAALDPLIVGDRKHG